MSVLHVMWKEILDNFRDRQTVFYALLFGPVLLPLLLGGILVASFKQVSIDFDEVTEVPVLRADTAPNLIAFLHSHNIDAVPVAADSDTIERNIRTGQWPIVLEIGEDYGTELREARPAMLSIHLDESDKGSARAARRLESVLDVHERTLNALRLQIRGIDTGIFDSLSITRHDVSIDGVSGQLIASLLPFLLIMSMVMGGFYLAIDTTAGERERHSLEPLLSLPLSARSLLLGKFAATAFFIALSVVLTSFSLILLFHLFPLELFGSRLRFDAPGILRALAVASPLIPFIAAMLIIIAALTQSTKEAQTYLGILMVIPMAPYFLLQFLDIRNSVLSTAMPMVSQYQLLERIVLGESLASWQLQLSIVGTLACSALILLQAVRLYRPERLLR